MTQNKNGASVNRRSIPVCPDIDKNHSLTHHAWSRMGLRGISLAKIQRVLEYGRSVHVRGAKIYVVGRKEVEHFALDEVELSDVEGVQVVCSTEGNILTVYRNRDFRGLRPRRSRRRYAR